MATKGLDAILSKDQELQKAKILEELMDIKKAKNSEKEHLEKKGNSQKDEPVRENKEEATAEELKPPKSKKKNSKKQKTDTYKYFRVIEASFEEKPKKNKEPLQEEKKPASPVYTEEPLSQKEKEAVEEAVEAPEEIIPSQPAKSSEEIERAIREEAEKSETERKEERRKAEEAENIKKKQDLLHEELRKSREEYAAKMKEAVEQIVGTSITPEEAARIESEGNVFRKTIIISRKAEAPITKPEPECYTLKIRKNEREIRLTNAVYIVGRRPECDISLPGETYVGRTHAEILVGDKITLRDLNSKNGTFVNGKKIDSAILEDGDIVTFADVDCILRRV